MEQLLTIPDNATQFTVTYFDEDNGENRTETFFIEDQLSIRRYSMFERFRIEVGFGLSFSDLVKVIQSNLEMFDRMVSGERGVFPVLVNTNYNALRGIDNAATKHPFAVWMCTLFMNTAGEDRRSYDELVMQRKIQIWEWAGVPASFFFEAGARVSKRFFDNLRANHPDVFGTGRDDEQRNRSRQRPKPDGEPAVKRIDQLVSDHRQYWADLLMAMADGNPAGMRELLEMDTVDFFYARRSWMKRIEAMNKPLKRGR